MLCASMERVLITEAALYVQGILFCVYTDTHTHTPTMENEEEEAAFHHPFFLSYLPRRWDSSHDPNLDGDCDSYPSYTYTYMYVMALSRGNDLQ